MSAAGEDHTRHDKEIADLTAKGYSQGQIADILGRSKRAVQRVQSRIGVKSKSPGMRLSRVTQLTDEDGKTLLTWRRHDADQEHRECSMRILAEELAKDAPKRRPASSAPRGTDRLLSVYFLSDLHVGMRSMEEETGDPSWSLRRSFDYAMDMFSDLSQCCPQTNECVLAELGDLVHYDGMLPVTSRSGAVLDVDCQPVEMIRMANRIMRGVIDMLLSRHRQVHVKICPGNHSDRFELTMREIYRSFLHGDSVKVDNSASPYLVHRFGSVMLGFTHGHEPRNKIKELGAIYMSQYRRMYGQTSVLEVHHGHLHHSQSVDEGGWRRIGHSTIASRDAHAARGGYLSEREGSSIVYHTRKGQVSQHWWRP